MKTRLLIILALAVIPIIDISFAEELEIDFGETVSYENLKLYFYDIEDSRCPSDVTCIWEGKISAMIHISNQTHKIGGPLEISYPVTYISPYTITLVDVKPHPISTEKPDYVAMLEITKYMLEEGLVDEQMCETGKTLVDGICVTSDHFRVGDPEFSREDLQRGETISNPEVPIIIQSLGAIMIVSFIILYAIKKRIAKKNASETR